MSLIATAFVIVLAFNLVNLLFCLGVIRRLREHTEMLDRLDRRGGLAPDSVILAPGGEVADFATSTVDGGPLSRDDLVGSTLVGFFSPGCPACIDRLPEFVTYARDHPGGRGHVLSVVVGPDDDESAVLVAQLRPVARVVRDADNGAVQAAFGVRGLPAFALLDGSVLRTGGFELDALAVEPTGP